jgi:hypothetical protein
VLAFGARLAITVAQLGASGSTAVTLVSVMSPVFVMAIVKLAVPPLTTCCKSGVLATTMDGLISCT